MENTQNAALLEILPDIERAARHVASEWSGVVDREDLEQEISLRLIQDHYAATVFDMELPARKRVLFKIGTQLASQEAVDMEHFSGNFTYGANEVRTLLDRGALVAPGHELVGDTFVEYGEDGGATDVQACQISVEGIDVRTAFERLTARQQELLTARYVHGEVSGEASIRVRTGEAVNALTHEMNRGRRRAHEEYRSR